MHYAKACDFGKITVKSVQSQFCYTLYCLNEDIDDLTLDSKQIAQWALQACFTLVIIAIIGFKI
jgi:hypothetical protein